VVAHLQAAPVAGPHGVLTGECDAVSVHRWNKIAA
jgi:hypothetical protein